MQKRDTIGKTFLVATLLCLICSAAVSLAAVGLKSIQDRNVALDRKKNLLEVTGFEKESYNTSSKVDELFGERFDIMIIDLETGEEALDEAYEAFNEVGKKFGDGSKEEFKKQYDQFWASKSKNKLVATEIEKKEDIASVNWREKYSHVFVMKDENDQVQCYVFPVRGYGLWSMLRGYLAVKPDFQTVNGLTFYDQKETPGLGGEVVSQKFKDHWPGKQIFEGDEVALEVVKGLGEGDYQIDGLSGATITSKGVSNMLEYWLGPAGFKPFIEKQKAKSASNTEAGRNSNANLNSANSIEVNNDAGANHG